MTKALVLKSRMRQKSHVRFGSGGRGHEAPAHHNWTGYYNTKGINLRCISRFWRSHKAGIVLDANGSQNHVSLLSVKGPDLLCGRYPLGYQDEILVFPTTGHQGPHSSLLCIESYSNVIRPSRSPLFPVQISPTNLVPMQPSNRVSDDVL